MDYYFGDAKPAHTKDYIWPFVIRVIKESGAKTVFDLGCGNGSFVAYLRSLGYEARGVDPSKSGIQAGLTNDSRLPISIGSAYEDLAALYGTHDCVVSLEVVEHIYYPRKFATTARSLLKPSGIMIVSTPYHSYLKNLALALTGKVDRHFTALWDHGHIKFWSVSTLSRLFEEQGLRRKRVHLAGRIPVLAKSMILVFRLEKGIRDS